MKNGKVIAVSLSAKHSIKKFNQSFIHLIEGYGVEGDAHAGKKVKHRYLVRKDPERPNLRQAHIISLEIYRELQAMGFVIEPGTMGENITTEGIDIMHLPENTIMEIGGDVRLKVTGMREPCHLLNELQDGLMKACIKKDGSGKLIRKAGIMTVIHKGGMIVPGDEVRIILPQKPFIPMKTV